MRFEELSTLLVQTAPELDGAVIDELVGELRGWGSPLALSIARVVEYVADGLTDPGVALPALAMACATLADGLRGRLTERELEAARNEIETLMPMPDKPPKFSPGSDLVGASLVPLTSLRRRS